MQERIEAALEAIFRIMEERPEKNALNIQRDLWAGRQPEACPVSLGRVQHYTEVNRLPEGEPNREVEAPEERLLGGLESLARGPQYENPWMPALGVGFGTSDVATAFGVEPDLGNPANPGGVVEYLPLEHFDGFETPDLSSAGLFPYMREYIECYRAHTPPDIKINFPDLQGPINIAHIILGTELFIAMYTERERLHRLMQRITEFLIQCFTVFPQWIGEERLVPGVAATKRLAECSVNLVSRELYREWGLPYDRQIAEALGEIGIHPCGGKHVFEETLRGLPHVVYTEWADCANAFAVQVSQEEAIAEIGDRQIVLSGGKEIWDEDPEQAIREALARMEDHPLQSFGFSGMRWRAGDEEYFTQVHRRIDSYYEERFAG